MCTLVSLTIGHNVAGTPTHDTAHVAEQTARILGVDAFTAIPCLGMWRGEAENSTRIEIVTDDATASEIAERVPYLAYALMQEAIMCEIRPASVTFPARPGIEEAHTA